MDLSSGQMQEWINMGLQYGLYLVYAIVIWLIGSRIASWVSDRVKATMMKRDGMDEALAGFASSMLRWLILAVVLIAILEIFGIDSTSLVAMLGAATLAVGLALQGTLANFAAGVMLLMFRPFRVGHYVEVAGHSGTVKNIDMFVTELVTVDNVQIIIPNSQTWSTAVVNYSAHDRRRMDLTVGIDYGANMEKAIGAIRNLIDADPRASGEPEPFVKVTNLGDSSVDVSIRVWCDAADYWDLKFDLTKKIKESFDAEGISIPYPHMEVIQKST